MESVQQIDNQLFKIRQKLKNHADKKCFLSPDEIQNLLKASSELILKKKSLLNKSIYSESKFNMLFEQIMSNLVKQGGHVFSNVGPILKENIKPTIDKLNEILFKPLGITQNMWTSEIGSVGKKDQSGDIDIALDFSQIKKVLNVESDQEVRKILMDRLTEAGIQNRQKVNNVHMAFPIVNSENNELVQIDLFPSNDLQFTKQQKFSPYAKDSKYKGVHRRLAIASLIKAVTLAIADDAVDEQKNEYVAPDGRKYPGLRFKFITLNDDGFFQVTKQFNKKRSGQFKKAPDEDKSKRQLITKNFQQMLDIVFGKGLFNYQKDLYSFETIWNNIIMSQKFPYKDKRDDIVKALNGIFKETQNGVPTEVTEYMKAHNLQ